MTKITIDANKRSSIYAYCLEIIQYRELLANMAYRDFRIRYARTSLGVSWAMVQPLLTLLVFTVVFQQFLKVDSGKTPYLLFALSGLFVWNYFVFVVSNAGSSLINYRNIIQKVYFPRLVLPLSKVLLGLADLLINFLLLIVLMFIYLFLPPSNLIFLPVFLLMLIVFSLGLGLWVCSLSIYYRDIQALMPYLLQIGLYISPVAYPDKMVPEHWRWLYFFNPLVGILSGIRWSLFGEPLTVWAWISFGLILLIFVSAFLYFRSVEDIISDIL